MVDPNEYTVGWICAITTEYVAAQAFLDEKHESSAYLSPQNKNDYTLGRLANHNVVIAVLPIGEYGTSSAARVAETMLHSFPNVRIGLMVGIGGGAPSADHDIRLGDIVVSTPSNNHGGVFQYDYGKTIQGQRFFPTGYLDQPPAVLRAAVNGLQARYEIEGHHLAGDIDQALERNPRLRKKYGRPDPASDRLYQSHIVHPPHDKSNCTISCGDDPSTLVLRNPRTEDEDSPIVHYGLVASANQLMKDACMRDKLTMEKDVLCFEMEAAGLMNHFPCLVIRGICDYSDSHKNKAWQGYAAMAAAAYTKDVLRRISPQHVQAEKKIMEILSTVKTIHETTQDIDRGVKRLRQLGDDQEYQAVINWLTPVNYALQQNDFIARRQEGTGEWFLNSTEFKQWLSQSKQTLFCPGMPGAGKTMITATVIDHLYRTYQNKPKTSITYIYCNFRQQHQQRYTDLLLSLLKQLVQGQPFIPNAVRVLYDECKGRGSRPSHEGILSTLYSVAASYSRLFILIDALDECQVSNEDRERFLRIVFGVQERTKANILVTSRFVHEIEKRFGESIRLEIRASDMDVQRYIEQRLQSFPSFVLHNPALQAEIKTNLARAVEGMFLLAKLYLDSLVYKTTPKAIRCVLAELEVTSAERSKNGQKSKVLDHAYNQAMERIRGQAPEHQKLANRVLSWIACATRSLTLSELQEGLAVEFSAPQLDDDNMPDIGQAVSVCAGLVIVDERSDAVRLVHYTTQEYFERTYEEWLLQGHSNITKACLTYLSFQEFDYGHWLTSLRLITTTFSNPLYEYAALNWGYHARKAGMEEDNLVLDFIHNASKFSICGQLLLHIKLGGGIGNDMESMHLAACLGLSKSMSILLKQSHGVDPRDSFYMTPLLWAAMQGHEATVELLLENGADVNSADAWGMTSLSRAAERGHDAVVKLLLEWNADIEEKTRRGDTPLSVAARYGHEAVVRALLGGNAIIEARNKYGYTALLLAVQNGHEAVVSLLLEKGANTEIKGYLDRTPLLIAVENRDDAMVRLLLSKNPNIEARDSKGLTPLSLAAWGGDETVVRRLLERNANINSKCGRCFTAFYLAAKGGHKAVADLLKEARAL
ncbi:Ankyrin repeat-containing domain-containing protein [Aspergillus oryzae]|uniref:Ankyrin repeat-containing domain-containing protein n=2 Tax=Aspergillus oryzae TaxID=5062 RepID=A0A1S9DFX0_ASPOZ|nr:Ankyrin repeat-containing domain-containing protein [Aspergillus oryzae]